MPAALIAALAFAAMQGDSTASRRVVPHPDDSTKHVEYFEVTPAGHGPWPAIVFLHGYQDPPSPGARVYVNTGVLADFARRGYVAVAVSMTGMGGSSGPDDFAGPFAEHAVEAVLRTLRASGDVQPDHIVLEGVSLGAMTAGLVAAQDPHLAGVIVISGEADPYAALLHPHSLTELGLMTRAMVRVGGGTALRSRSMLDAAARIKVPALIINGANDDRTDPAHARQLAAAINAHGGHARFVLVPGAGHQIPFAVRAPIIDSFLASLGGASGASGGTR